MPSHALIHPNALCYSSSEVPAFGPAAATRSAQWSSAQRGCRNGVVPAGAELVARIHTQHMHGTFHGNCAKGQSINEKICWGLMYPCLKPTLSIFDVQVPQS